VNQDKTNDNLSIVPPETSYIVEKRVLWIPANDPHLNDRWQLRLYAEKLLEKELGDEVQLTSLKVKKPGIMRRAKSKLKKQESQVRLIATVKF
jgi:hypothetical protein